MSSFNIGNGQNGKFYEDISLGDTPLSHQYHSLYNIVQRKQVSVVSILEALTNGHDDFIWLTS